MKARHLILILGATLALAGCATNQGGTAEEVTTTTGTTNQFIPLPEPGESHPQPAGSPTFRPGMNPRDPRDSQFITRPQPQQAPQLNIP